MNLMIVAHPDDEILFGGAKLLTGSWKVVCVTNGDNAIRSKEFTTVMSSIGCEFEIWSYPDRWKRPLPLNVFNDIKKVIDLGWDKIVSHGEAGEYGHLHHCQIHRMIKAITNFIPFEFGEELPDSIWQSKCELLKHYKSQAVVCDRFSYLSRREKI